MTAAVGMRFGHRSAGTRITALFLALILSLSVAMQVEAQIWVPISLYRSGTVNLGMDVTMDGLKTIGKSTSGGLITGSAGGLVMAGAAASGIITAPATPLAYLVPVVTGIVGGFLNGVKDAFWDGNARLTSYDW